MDVTRRLALAARSAERAARRRQIDYREVRRIENVDAFEADLKLHAFTDTEVFREAGIEVQKPLVTQIAQSQRKLTQSVGTGNGIDVAQTDARVGTLFYRVVNAVGLHGSVVEIETAHVKRGNIHAIETAL